MEKFGQTPQEEKDGLKSKLQKAAAIGAVGVAAMTGEACSPEDTTKNVPVPEKGKSEQYDPVLDPSRGFYKIDQREFARNLSSYLTSIESGRSPSSDESMARARDFIQKSGMFKNAREASPMVLFKGGVPVEIKVNGENVPLNVEWYTEAEREAVKRDQ